MRDAEKAARRALAALARRSVLRRAAEITGRDGAGLWVVGGALRDRALGRRTTDSGEIDLATSGDAERLAQAMEHAGLGRAVFLSRGRPGPRVFRLAGAGAPPLDLAEIEGGSIEADLARRDFTVNALALDLRNGAVLDPFGGLGDLSRRTLRCVRPGNLAEDPLRALRAARLFATHGLRPDAETLRESRRVAARLDEVAPERIGAELSKLFAADRVAPALEWAATAGLLRGALRSDLSRARARELARALRAADVVAIRRMTPARRRRLRLALLACAAGLRPGEIRSWLAKLRWGRREADEVARLAELADSAAAVRSNRAGWAWLLEAGALEIAEDALRLLSLWRPDARAPSRRLQRLRRLPRRSVTVRGGDVVDWLRIPPGPAVGEWLSRVRVAAAMGEVKNRREARTWLRGQSEKALRPL